jgi:hypothetical protein
MTLQIMFNFFKLRRNSLQVVPLIDNKHIVEEPVLLQQRVNRFNQLHHYCLVIQDLLY